MDEELGIGISVAGSKEALQQLQPVINIIQQFSLEVDKLSQNLNTALSTLLNFSKQSNSLSKGILKSKNNRLNLGDLANIETEKYSGSQYRIYVPSVQEVKEVTNEVQTLNREVSKTPKQIKKTEKSLNQVNKATEKVSRTLKSVFTIAFARQFGRTMSNLVEISGSWIENLNLFAVTFGESNYREMLDWATDYADKLGLANNEIVKMTGYYKQLSTSIGLTNETGTELSQLLTQLTYDFGSFYNVTFASVQEKLQAGIFSGQIRTLRTLGIDVSQAQIQNLLDTADGLKELGASATQLSQTDKVLARVILTMRSGSNAFGDLARSIDTLQNRQRVFTASIENLKLAIGDTFSEYIRQALGYMIGFVQAVTEAIRIFKPLQDELTYDIGDTVFTEISEDAEEMNNTIGKLSFDKFETLSGSGGQLSITEALTAELEKQTELYNEVAAQFEGIDKEVVKVKNSILQWIFPLSEVDEETGELILNTSKLNDTITTIKNVAVNFWESFKSISPELIKVMTTLGEIVSSIVKILDDLNLLYPVLLAIVGLNLYKKMTKLLGLEGKFTSFISSIGEAQKRMTAIDYLASNKAYDTTSKALTGLRREFTKTIEVGGKSVRVVDKLKVATTGLNSVVAGVMAFTLADSFFGQFQKESKVIAGAIGTVVAALTAVAVAAMAATGALSWGTAIPAIVAAIAVGVAGVKAMIEGSNEIKGFATGGIPAKSELFYMNENGVPEALVNTGGSQTNVINIDQLSEGMRRGFVQAIYDTGLNNNGNVTIKIDGNINDSAFARAIFPALKTESTRRGGNQL